MRNIEKRLQRLEQRIHPQEKYCSVAFQCPNDPEAESAAQRMREQGFEVIEVQIVTHENIGKWKEYDRARAG